LLGPMVGVLRPEGFLQSFYRIQRQFCMHLHNRASIVYQDINPATLSGNLFCRSS
jgi:hypothetical protein